MALGDMGSKGNCRWKLSIAFSELAFEVFGLLMLVQNDFVRKCLVTEETKWKDVSNVSFPAAHNLLFRMKMKMKLVPY